VDGTLLLVIAPIFIKPTAGEWKEWDGNIDNGKPPIWCIQSM
jgi:hypothetical protein